MQGKDTTKEMDPLSTFLSPFTQGKTILERTREKNYMDHAKATGEYNW